MAMGISALVALLIAGYPLKMMAQQIGSGIQSYPLMAVPFFIFAGNMMNATGLTTRIFAFARNIIGHIKGGLGQVNVIASLIFAGISGAALADVGGLGTIEIKAMKEAGYSNRMTLSVTTASSVIGPIFPPSIGLVIYAVQAEQSIGRLFVAGILPGLTIAIMVMLLVYYLAASGRENCPVDPRPKFKTILKSLWKSFFAIMSPVFILWCIVGGVVTPTEAGALAVFYATFVGLFYGDIHWKDLPHAVVASVLTTSLVMLLIGIATVMGWILAVERVPYQLAEMLLSLTANKYLLLLIINFFLLLLGCVLESVPALIITVPVLLPVVLKLGVDPVHFGIIIVFNVVLGLITPPLGISLYLVSSLVGMRFEEAVKSVMPYLLVLIAALFVITYIPLISLYLPNLLMP
jgi:tripartite ATP-independent transporter DctM subunit